VPSPYWIPACAGMTLDDFEFFLEVVSRKEVSQHPNVRHWIPAFAGMTRFIASP
jgi:hypothetical protein